MKNTNVISLRLVGIIALIAVIGFSFVACGGDDDGNGNGNGGGGAGLTATSGKFKEDKIRIRACSHLEKNDIFGSPKVDFCPWLLEIFIKED